MDKPRCSGVILEDWVGSRICLRDGCHAALGFLDTPPSERQPEDEALLHDFLRVMIHRSRSIHRSEGKF